jgi:uncharacterized protein involved in response to NO
MSQPKSFIRKGDGAIPIRRWLVMAGTTQQESFGRVAGILRSALLIGAGGGFLFAAILTLTAAFRANDGAWWAALAQAHGQLQLYGWAGLFVLGVALHFLPRLRGTPLAMPHLVPWLFGLQVASIILRGLSQPLAAASSSGSWSFGLVVSGLLECAAIGMALACGVQTFLRGQPITKRPALVKVLPLLAIAFASLGLAALVNLANTMQAQDGMMLEPGDTLNITLGIFGFLVPMALAMSAQALPMYAGLTAFSKEILWSLAAAYLAGLVLLLAGIASETSAGFWGSALAGAGMLFIGTTLLVFVVSFIRMIRSRGRVPAHMARLSPSPEQMERHYHDQLAAQRSAFGPFVALVASAYLWASLAAVLLLVDGIALLVNGTTIFAVDAIRHSLTVGFITLLISGIAPRMITSFSGGRIASPGLVTATLWLGNSAALLRVGSILVIPLVGGASLFQRMLFGASGPCGLAVAICLAINLWPALRPSPRP